MVKAAATRALVLVTLLSAAAPALAATSERADLGALAVELLRDLIRIDTTNPPGNETAAARFLASFFRENGIEAQVYESEPGRGSVLARVPGRVRGGGVVLLSHLDVVPADASEWSHPPFAADLDGDWIWGRGAVDAKGVTAVEAAALVGIARRGRPPRHDVVLLATAGEETGGALGAGWFVEHHLDDLRGAEFVLNEGGAIRTRDGSQVYEVAVAEKSPLWLRLRVRGTPGHGSTPRADAAVHVLVRALARILALDQPVRVVPEVQRMYAARARLVDQKALREAYGDLARALRDAAFRDHFLSVPADAALVRNTLAVTVLRGSSKTNVVPAVAEAEIDCRLLPGEDPDAFERRLREAAGDSRVEFERILYFPPSSSPTDTPLFRAIESVGDSEGAAVVPVVLRGFTDSHFFREKGLVSYGFVPWELGEDEAERMHGIDERVRVDALRAAPDRLIRILDALEDRGGSEASPRGWPEQDGRDAGG